MTPVAPTDPRIKAIAKRCAKVKNGKSTVLLMAETGMCRCLVQSILRQCKKQNLLVPCKVPGGAWNWMSVADKTALESDPANAKRMKRRRHGRELYRGGRDSGRIDSRNQVVANPDGHIQRSYITAGSVPPPVTRAVNSVFALGGAV